MKNRLLKYLLCALLCIGFYNAVPVFAEDLLLQVDTLNAGNIFFTGDEPAFSIHLKNMTPLEKNLTATYSVYDQQTLTEREISHKHISIGSNNDYHDNLIIKDIVKYGLYSLNISVKENGSETIRKEIPFSVCVFVPSSKRNNKMGVSGHFNWNRDCKTGMYIIDSVGIGNIREGYNWNGFESKKGIYAESEANTDYLSNADKHSLDVLVMAGFSNSLYANSIFDFPKTEEQRNAFAEYVLKMLETNDNYKKIKCLEVWNEPDLKTKSAPEKYASPEEYALLLKTVYEKVKPIFPGIKIGAPSLAKSLGRADTSGADISGQAWLRSFLGQDFDNDGTCDTYKYFDVLLIHQYDIRYDLVVEQLKIIDNILADYNCADKEIYHTEFGISEVRKNRNEGDVIQAERLIRYYLTMLANGCAEKYYIYDFSDDGTDPGISEQNFGLCQYHNGEVPYAAKTGLLAVAALNYLSADMNKIEFLDSASSDIQNVVKLKMTDDQNNKFFAFYINSIDIDYREEYVFPYSNENIKFFDFLGNRIYPEKTNAGYKLIIGSQPIYASECIDKTGALEYIKTKRYGKKVCASGKIKNANESDMVGIEIIDPSGNLFDIQQICSDINGEFQFEFYPATDGIYSIRMGTKVLGKIEKYTLEWNSAIKAITAVYDGEQFIDTFEQYSKGQNLKISVSIEDILCNEFTLIVGYFSQGKLLKCDIIPKSQMSLSNNVYYCDTEKNIPDKTDSIRIMTVDNMNNIKPLYNYLMMN